MGEANPEASVLIARLTGHAPENGHHADDTQFLRIGEVVIHAMGFALWSDPSVFIHNVGNFTVVWGGQHTHFTRNAEGRWEAAIRPNLLSGKARFVV